MKDMMMVYVAVLLIISKWNTQEEIHSFDDDTSTRNNRCCRCSFPEENNVESVRVAENFVDFPMAINHNGMLM